MPKTRFFWTRRLKLHTLLLILEAILQKKNRKKSEENKNKNTKWPKRDFFDSSGRVTQPLSGS